MKREFKVFGFSMIINLFIFIIKISGGVYFNFASLISDGMQTLVILLLILFLLLE